MSFTVDIAGQTDAAAMAELHFISHTVSFAEFASLEWVASRKRSDYLEQWQSFFAAAANDKRSRAWKVQVDDGSVVGIVKVGPMTDSEAQLSSMHVHPDYQRQGIGSALMSAASEFMADTGFSTAILGVIQANAPARAIYERHGWTVRELRPDGIEGVPIAVYEINLKSVGRG